MSAYAGVMRVGALDLTVREVAPGIVCRSAARRWRWRLWSEGRLTCLWSSFGVGDGCGMVEVLIDGVGPLSEGICFRVLA